MEDIRNYRIEEDEDESPRQDSEREWNAAPADDEVPFHIPRD
jgi:hypothetical protein